MKIIILIILILLITMTVNAQKSIYSSTYKIPKIGIYESQSLKYSNNIKEINPQKWFSFNGNIQFINVNYNEIVLFKSIPINGNIEPAGFLKQNSVVEIDTIYYFDIFQDTSNVLLLTFNVWYALNINGNKYYTDYKVHDNIAYKTILKELNQKFLLISQSTGYDYNYNIGYPNFFFIAILNEKDELIYSSDILDFDYVDEYWEQDINLYGKFESGIFYFQIVEVENSYRTWDGNELKKYDK